MTGATSSTAGAAGLAPAPSSGDQNKFLRGDGTWAALSSSTIHEFALDNVTNVSGSYSHTTTNSDVLATMKPIMISCGTPATFQDSISVTVDTGEITLACSSVSGSSTVTVLLADTATHSIPAAAGESF